MRIPVFFVALIMAAGLDAAYGAELKRVEPLLYLYGPGRLKALDSKGNEVPYGIEKVARDLSPKEFLTSKAGEYAIAIATLEEDILWKKYRIFIYSGGAGTETGWYIASDQPRLNTFEPKNYWRWIASGEEAARFAKMAPPEETLQLVVLRVPLEAARKETKISDKRFVAYLRSIGQYLNKKAEIARSPAPKKKRG